MDHPEDEKPRPFQKMLSNIRALARREGGKTTRELSEAHFETYDVALTVGWSRLLPERFQFTPRYFHAAARSQGEASAVRS
jgi:hypothetical protein